MKILYFFLGFALFVTNQALAQDKLFDQVILPFVNDYPIITLILVLGHICITIGVCKSKGFIWGCAYFLLAPLIIFVFLLGISGAGGVKSKRK